MTVERLAASAQEQEAYLRQLGTAPCADELALEFDGLIGVEQDLSEPARNAALVLHRYLTEFSGQDKAELWTVTALHEAPEWARVRQLASNLLQRMDEQTSPDG